MARYGKIRIKLDELLKKSGMSKNKLSQRAEMQRTQLNHYCNNTITRLDTDVLARLCTVLDCEIGDLLEFVPPEDADPQYPHLIPPPSHCDRGSFFMPFCPGGLCGFCHCLSCEHIVSKSSLLFRQT